MKIPKIKLTITHLCILAILLIILSFAFVLYQYNNRKLDIQEKQSREEKVAEINRKKLLDSCLNDADDVYWDYIKLNSVSHKDNEDGTIAYDARKSDIDEAQKMKDKEVELCELKYGK